jgi:predicted nuclease of predicted toxin-antitoxin system
LKLLADENIDASIVHALRADGHDVLYVVEMQPGVDDDQVLREAESTRSVLLTEDKDFGFLVYRQRKITSGVLLIRLAGLSNDAKAEIVRESVRKHSAKLENAFSVMSPGYMRIRTI